MCHQKFSVVPNNSIYDSTSYFPVRPSHSANTYAFSKYIWLMYYFFSSLQYINKTGFRVCFKELYETKYDPLTIIYTVMSGKYLGT